MEALFERLRSSFEAITRQPGRSALTVLGLCIGVGAFIAMISFGEGARRSVLSQFQALGTNVMKISSYGRENARPPEPLTDADLRAIERESAAVVATLPVARHSLTVSFEREQRGTNVYGTTPRFTSLHAWELGSGGMFDRTDVEQAKKVCVIGVTPARALFGDTDPLGKTVTLGGILPCHVIGELVSKGYATNGDDLDDLIVIPVTTYNNYLGDQRGYPYVEVEPASPALLDEAKAEVTAILRRTHKLDTGDENDFTIKSPLEVIRAADRTARILSALLAGIAAVSLLVGGIGIMNIQLVSVAERTAEIGVRSAIGASPRQILTQFLSEAVALSVVGVLLGIVLGVAVASLVAGWMGWPRVISPAGVALAASFGSAVGVAFGYLPARRAASMDPIDALRHE